MASMSTERLIQLCHRVGISLKSGVPILRIWESEAKVASGVGATHCEDVRQALSQGRALADALRDTQGYFPSLVCDMVEVGEKTGTLETVWLKLEEHYKHQQSLRNNFLRGIAWPMFQLAFAIFIVGGLIGLLGVISDTMGGDPVDISGVGLVGMRGAIIFWLICGVVLGWIGLMIYSVIQGWWGPAPIQLAMRIPVLGKALESLALSRLTWSLAMALNSGMDAIRSVELAVRTTLNLYYTSHLQTVTGSIRRGDQFFEAFAKPQVYPQDFITAMQVAEISGTTSESLERLSEQYQEKARSAMNVLTAASTVAVMLLVGIVLVFLIFRMAMKLYIGPIYDALEQI